MTDALGGTLGGIAGTLQGSVAGLVNKGQSYLDKFFPPEKRGELMGQFSQFLSEKPKLASFILSQIAISGIPMGLFICMTVTVALFSIIAALLIALLGAILFIVFCVGVALCVLLPTLFFTTAVATFLWLWGMGLYYLFKWFNQDEINNIKEATGKLLSFPSAGEGSSANDNSKASNAGGNSGRSQPPKLDKAADGGDGDDDDDEHNGKEKKHKPKKLANGSAKKNSNQSNGDDDSNHPDNKYTVADGVGKATGFDGNNATDGLKKHAGNVGDKVGGVTDKTGGVTDKLGGVTGKADGLKNNVPGGVL